MRIRLPFSLSEPDTEVTRAPVVVGANRANEFLCGKCTTETVLVSGVPWDYPFGPRAWVRCNNCGANNRLPASVEEWSSLGRRS
jgi:hypothetical protein